MRLIIFLVDRVLLVATNPLFGRVQYQIVMGGGG